MNFSLFNDLTDENKLRFELLSKNKLKQKKRSSRKGKSNSAKNISMRRSQNRNRLKKKSTHLRNGMVLKKGVPGERIPSLRPEKGRIEENFLANGFYDGQNKMLGKGDRTKSLQVKHQNQNISKYIKIKRKTEKSILLLNKKTRKTKEKKSKTRAKKRVLQTAIRSPKFKMQNTSNEKEKMMHSSTLINGKNGVSIPDVSILGLANYQKLGKRQKSMIELNSMLSNHRSFRSSNIKVKQHFSKPKLGRKRRRKLRQSHFKELGSFPKHNSEQNNLIFGSETVVVPEHQSLIGNHVSGKPGQHKKKRGRRKNICIVPVNGIEKEKEKGNLDDTKKTEFFNEINVQMFLKSLNEKNSRKKSISGDSLIELRDYLKCFKEIKTLNMSVLILCECYLFVKFIES